MTSHQTLLCQSLDDYRGRLADAVRSDSAGAAELLDRQVRFPDVHVASGCLQKAVRRGEMGHALAAGRYLLSHDPGRLWRRLCVCAFEDLGMGDLDTTAMVTVAAASRNLRLALGETAVLDRLIVQLCRATKDRRLDDLYALGAAGLAHGHVNLPTDALGALVHRTSRLIGRCERKIPNRSFRVIEPAAATRMLKTLQGELGLGQHLVALCDLGTKVSRCLLPVLLPLALDASTGATRVLRPVAVAPASLIGGIPAYAIDGFTRVGRQVLGEIARTHVGLRALSRDLGHGDRLDVLHHVLFFAEGAVSTPLLEDELSCALNAAAIAVGARAPANIALQAVAMMAELLPLEDARRRAALACYPDFFTEGER